jgi:hypothetical protein
MRHALRPAIIAAAILAPAAAFAGSAIHHMPPKSGPPPTASAPQAGVRPARLSSIPVVRPSELGRPHRHNRPRYGQFWGFPYAYPPAVVETLVVPAAVEPALRRIRPRSFNVIDPAAIISRTPSGRVVVSSPGAYHGGFAPLSAPYAPPSFQFIGAASGRYMGRPVELKHGVAAPAGLPLNPKVVWLKEQPGVAKPLKSAE